MNFMPVVATAVTGMHHGAWSLIASAGAMVKIVMGILVLASIVCWAIIFSKYFLFRELRKKTQLFLDHFYEGQSWEAILKQIRLYEETPLARLFQAGYQELQHGLVQKQVEEPHVENISRSLRRASGTETTRLEKFVGFLATTGSTAPFIGLFGTVWGIMNSFQSIGATGVANLAVVAPGISEALIATAIGLAVAIPAVVAFNYFQSRVRLFEAEMENFAADFITLIKRNY